MPVLFAVPLLAALLVAPSTTDVGEGYRPTIDTPAQGCMQVEFETTFIDYSTEPDGSFVALHSMRVTNLTATDLLVAPNNAPSAMLNPFLVPAFSEAVSTVASGASPYLSEEWYREAPTRDTDSTFVAGVSFVDSDGSLYTRIPGCDMPPNHGQDPATSPMGDSWVVLFALPGRGPTVQPELPQGTVVLEEGTTRDVDVLRDVVSFYADIDVGSLTVERAGTVSAAVTSGGMITFSAPLGTAGTVTQVELSVCTVDNWCAPFQWQVEVSAAAAIPQPVGPDGPQPDTEPINPAPTPDPPVEIGDSVTNVDPPTAPDSDPVNGSEDRTVGSDEEVGGNDDAGNSPAAETDTAIEDDMSVVADNDNRSDRFWTSATVNVVSAVVLLAGLGVLLLFVLRRRRDTDADRY